MDFYDVLLHSDVEVKVSVNIHRNDMDFLHLCHYLFVK